MTIRIENVSFSRTRCRILSDISFSARPGRLMALLGANGSGKSTLLSLIAGDLVPEQGHILYGNKPVSQFSRKDLALKRAFMIQKSNIWADVSTTQIVALGRLPYQPRERDDESQRIAREIMREQYNSELIDRCYNKLSGGEQQRVHFSRIVAQVRDIKNPLILLDEPSAGVDVKFQILLLNQARALASSGATVIIALHDLNLAAQHTDDGVIIGQQRLIAVGEISSVLQSEYLEQAYKTPFHIMKHPTSTKPLIFPQSVKTA